MEAVRGYLMSVIAVSLLTGTLLALTPKGSSRRTLTFLCGLAVILTAIGPAARIRVEDLASALARAGLEASESAAPGISADQDLTAALIKEKAEAYILGEAAALGFSPSAEVTVETGGDFPYPSAVTISGACSAAQRAELQHIIEAELAIPPERQEWRTDEKE